MFFRKLNSLTLLIALFSVALTFSGSLEAQNTRKVTLPKPENVTLATPDGVQLRCTYYPGGVLETVDKETKRRQFVKKPGKQVVPVILLHGWEGRRTEFAGLADQLQRRGHAVVAPDLRGHGDSLVVRFPSGDERRIDPKKMRSPDFQAMVVDVQTVKKFLLKKNNEGVLNIELLCVVGAELGTIVAANWAEVDWSRRQLPSFKQGRDVKAMVLLTPLQSYKGLSATRALKHPVVGGQLSTMIVVGRNDRKNFSDAKAIHKRLERLHREPASAADQDLFLVERNTSLKGTQLVNPNARLGVERLIAGFIGKRLVQQGSRFAWRERTNPLAQVE